MRLRWKVLIALVVAVVGARAALPYVVLGIANRQLNSMEGLRGRIGDIDLALLRGAYRIEGIDLVKTADAGERQFISIEDLFISVDWSALMRRALVARVVFTRPRVTLEAAAAPRDKPKPTLERDLQKQFESLFPLRIDRFEVVDGEVNYTDRTKKAPIEVEVEDLDVVARNLTNSERLKTSQLSSIEARARVYDSGRLKVSLKADPTAEPPDFDINAQLTGLQAAELNDLLRSFGGFDAERGTISLFVEAAAKDGFVKGYAKPILEDLKILSRGDRREGPLRALWESIVGAASEVFENQPTERLGAKVPFQGRLASPDVGLWSAAASVLRNAFVAALLPRLEGAIELRPGENGRDK